VSKPTSDRRGSASDAQAPTRSNPATRVFVAGGSGLLGLRLIPLLVADGHEVVAMTRTAAKAPLLEDLGATPLVCDVFDLDAFIAAVGDFAPSVLIHGLTNLPDERAQMAEYGAQHLRTLREGTSNVVAASASASVPTLIVQSIAWDMPGDGGSAYAELERLTLNADGIILRFGYWYGEGTWSGTRQPPAPRIHIEAAAARTAAALDLKPGIHVIAEPN
jgi:hypothetical protein